jgi:nucleoid-associated protein YgaU
MEETMSAADRNRRLEPEEPSQPKAAAANPAAGPAVPKPVTEYIADHTVTPNDTLGAIALKYYGSAIREKWMPIYEANQEIIGSDPGRLKVGTVLKIPKESA